MKSLLFLLGAICGIILSQMFSPRVDVNAEINTYLLRHGLADYVGDQVVYRVCPRRTN